MTEQWNQSEEERPELSGDAPEGAGEGGFSGPRKPRVSGPTLVLFGAFASALVILYLLGMQNKPRAASADPGRGQKGPSAIAILLENKGNADKLNGLFTDTKKFVDLFYSLGTRDPKIMPLSHDPLGGQPQATREITSIMPANADEAARMLEVAQIFKTLKLQSVMLAGKNSAAMINNRMLELGSKIGDLTVSSIEPGRVLLSYGGHTFELKQTKGDEQAP